MKLEWNGIGVEVGYLGWYEAFQGRSTSILVGLRCLEPLVLESNFYVEISKEEMEALKEKDFHYREEVEKLWEEMDRYIFDTFGSRIMEELDRVMREKVESVMVGEEVERLEREREGVREMMRGKL